MSELFSIECVLHLIVVCSSVSPESKQQILQPLSVLRPKFRVRNSHVIFDGMLNRKSTGDRSVIERPGT